MRDFPDVILTTFTFDPLFFERIALADLAWGGAKRIVILADASQAIPAIHSVQNQLCGLGRAYRLIPVYGAGAFHPKLCIKISKTNAVVMCGSGNLTRSGWIGVNANNKAFGNREIASVFRITPDNSIASDFIKVRDQLIQLPMQGSDRGELDEILSPFWLESDNTRKNEGNQWYLSGIEKPLSSILEEKWQGRTFDKMHFLTGSTDSFGGMLRWAKKTFGIKEAVVHVDLNNCSFAAEKMKDIGISVKLATTTEPPRTHLKIAVFTSSDGYAAAVAGSANCSDSAWNRLWSENGNIESVILYPECDPKYFEAFFREDEKIIGLTDLPSSPVQKTETASIENEAGILLHIEVDKIIGEIKAWITVKKSEGIKVWAVINQARILLHYTGEEGVFVGSSETLKEMQITSLFGHVEIIGLAESKVCSNQMWVNDINALDWYSKRGTSFGKLPGFRKKGNTHFYQDLLRDIQMLAHDLLDDPGEDKYKKHIKPQTPPPKTAKESEPVDPNTLLKKLSETWSASPIENSANPAFGSLSLKGIYRIIFAESSESEKEVFDPTKAEAKLSSEEKDGEEGKEGSKIPIKDGKKTSDEKGNEDEKPTPRQAKSLLDQVSTYVTGLLSCQFAQYCTVNKLLQGIAFPIGIARLIETGPWSEVVSGNEMNALIEQICESLFTRNRTVPDSKTGAIQELKPLLIQVRERYEQQGMLQAYKHVVGDGTLWLVLCYALVRNGKFAINYFRHNYLLQNLVTNSDLISHSVPEKLKYLVSRLNTGAEDGDFIKSVLTIHDSFQELEKYLSKNYNQLKAIPCKDHSINDILWNSHVGFAFIESKEAQNRAQIHLPKHAKVLKVDLGFYINISFLLKEIPELAILVERCQPIDKTNGSIPFTDSSLNNQISDYAV